MVLKTMWSIMFLWLSLTTNIHADSHKESNKDNTNKVNYLHTLNCNFRPGKNMEDLYKVTKNWETWASEAYDMPYSAWLLTPVMFDARMDTHDVYWLGSSDSRVNLGKAMDQWGSASAFEPKVKKIREAFERVIDCDSGAEFRARTISFPENTNMGYGVAAFTTCKVNDGVGAQDVQNATLEYNKFRESTGNDSAHFRWYGGYGAPSRLEMSFVDVFVNKSWEHRAQNIEKMASNKAGDIRRELFSPIMQCERLSVNRFVQIKS